MEEFIAILISRVNYWTYILLLLIGLYAVVVKKNIVKKVIGMNIMQTAVILFYISIGVKKNAGIPIVRHAVGLRAEAVDPGLYINPLPHVLMLTAIVVAVATLGAALAMVIVIYRHCGTLEEDEILARLE